jgi:hypothetical protein
MKERILYEDDFENHLREKVDQLKIYPSDKVWNGINNSMHTNRRRFVAGMSVLIGGILVLAGAELFSPGKVVPTKNIAKISVVAKPLANADLHAFIPGALSSTAIMPEDQNANEVPFLSNETASLSTETAVNSPQILIREFNTPIKFQTAATDKAILSVDLKIEEKAVPALPELAKTANQNAAFNGFELSSKPGEISLSKKANEHNYDMNDRIRWEVYFSPTLNSHYLSGIHPQTISSSNPNSPIMVVHISNVNGFIDNTPAVGYDIGGNFLYRISKNIYLKAGLEFNYSRYYIKTYNSGSSQAVATLNSYLGYIADSLTNYSNNSSLGAHKNPEQIQNKYYQLSMPMGIEMNLAGRGKLQLRASATVQPSYLLNHDAYVLSEDYSSYSKESSSLRKWNLNAGGEIFLSYRIGKIRWELGPQVRYQIFSTYKTSYPLNENLLNYGIRVGFSKTIW